MATITIPTTSMEVHQLLGAAVAPETATASQATMSAFLQSKQALLGLAQQICSAPESDRRQLAAVLLRQRLRQGWRKQLSSAEKMQVREMLLVRLGQEPDRLVRHSIAALIAGAARQSTPLTKHWPQLLQTLLQYAQHVDADQRALAMVLFSALAETIPGQLRVHFLQLQQIFFRGLSDASSKVRTQSLHALSSLTDLVGDDESSLQTFASSVEPLLQLMIQLLQQQPPEEETVLAALDLVDNWLAKSDHIVQPHVTHLCAVTAQMLTCTSLEYDTRSKACSLLSDLLQDGAVSALGRVSLEPLATSLIQTACGLIASTHLIDGEDAPELDVSDKVVDSDGTTRAQLTQTQILGIDLLNDVLLHVTCDVTYAPTRAVLAALLSSDAVENHRAAYLVLAVMFEGCGKPLEAEGDFAPRLLHSGLNAADARVRYTASVALHDFARDMADAVVAHHQSLMPLAVQILRNPQQPLHIRRQCCTSLALMCEHIGQERADAFLPAIMNEVVTPLMSEGCLISEVFDLIERVAYVCSEHFLPFAIATIRGTFQILATIDTAVAQHRQSIGAKPEMHNDSCNKNVATPNVEEDDDGDDDEDIDNTDDDLVRWHGQRADALRCLAAVISVIDDSSDVDAKDAFAPFVALAIHHLERTMSCDDERESCYAFMKQLVPVLPSDLASVWLPPMLLTVLVSSLMKDAIQEDGHRNELVAGAAHEQHDDDEGDVQGDEEDGASSDDDRVVKRLSVHTGVVEEKVAALEALEVMITHCSADMLASSIKLIMPAMYMQLHYCHEDVRVAACNVQLSIWKWFARTQYSDGREQMWLNQCVSDWFEMIATGEDMPQVTAVLVRNLGELFRTLPYANILTTESYHATLIQVISLLLSAKAPAYIQADDDGDDDDAADASEVRVMLLKPTLKFIPVLARASGTQVFGAKYWPTLGPMLFDASQSAATLPHMTEAFAECTQQLAAIKNT